MDFTPAMERAALRFKDAIQARIESSVPPPNAQATIESKGHGLTLRDSYEFRNGIEIKVRPDGFDVGVFNPDIADRVFHNEHGTTTIPARPVFGPTFDGPVGKTIFDELENNIADKLMMELDG